jgi:uncharacterized protein (DUF302 family)
MRTSSLFPTIRSIAGVCTLVPLLFASTVVHADNPAPYPGTLTLKSGYGFDETVTRLEQSVAANKMGVVAKASASAGAAGRGVKIAGNTVLMVFRNDYAVRMLAASVPAGVEAPLRIYVTEDTDGQTRMTYRTPSAVFSPYGNAQIDAMARELDPIFDRIVHDVAAK